MDMPDPTLPFGMGWMGQGELLLLDGCGSLRVETTETIRGVLNQDRIMTMWVCARGNPWKRLPSEIWSIIQGMTHGRTCLGIASCTVAQPDDPDRCFYLAWVQFLFCENTGKDDNTGFVQRILDHPERGPEGVTPQFHSNREMSLLYKWRRAGYMRDWEPTFAEKALSGELWDAFAADRKQKIANERARQAVIREEREMARTRRHGGGHNRRKH
jgi:hypothetical protein